jgi:predicted metal-dependent peptidase
MITTKVKNNTRMWGKYTGDAKNIILDALEPKINCKDIIRRFGVSIITSFTQPTRKKANRRHDLLFPGYRTIYKPNIAFAVDASGSMSDEDLQYGFGVINKLIYFANITYILFDTEIKLIEKNKNKARKQFTVSGRGGTDYKQVFKYADDNKFDGLIVYTDGMAEAIPQPKYKPLWLLTNKEYKPPVDWGFSTWLDRFADDKK